MGFSDFPFVRITNRVFVALMNAPVLGGLVRRGLVVIRYQGRKSGTTFELPVGYRRSGDAIVIGVAMPDKKNWWRNFLGEGAPLTFVGLDGADRTAHAVAAWCRRRSLGQGAPDLTNLRRRFACGGIGFQAPGAAG